MFPLIGTKAEWTSEEIERRELLDHTVYSVLGNGEKKSNGFPQTISKIVVDYLENYRCFGESEWTLLGRVNPAPLLPIGFSAIWKGACPIFPAKKIRETHMLVYIPSTLDGQPLTLKKLGEITKSYFPESERGYGFIWQLLVDAGKSIDQSRWVLMTKDVLPGSRNKNYAEQQKMIAKLVEKSLINYEVPETLEAAICILSQYFVSKERLFHDNPVTFTICKELVPKTPPIFVGGFSLNGLCLNRALPHASKDTIGVAALRRF